MGKTASDGSEGSEGKEGSDNLVALRHILNRPAELVVHGCKNEAVNGPSYAPISSELARPGNIFSF